ncbi:TIGR03985 family CRISPR-associated protein [Limnofasciculus baicalensis]|uniref:TIGR03985 family CRISPR-associated protein n=1 Tax=Limnofasciculus baicalensis BBK-W-15 TaxID=2699891 RepID=A0AAE3KQC2_9CYAN|nr:TIGR03985 family CRISPR-associated protein [Limnofasciculus baicalensis]MCP2727172.1 TIGR03985 family CRISPR-associated protein [Limnofasciculus baicalensis BBK-W-15]
MDITFHTPPKPALLQKLAKGALEQSQNLTRAVRLWVLLRWLYSDDGYLALPNSFTYTDWRKAFFTENHQDEKQEDIENHQDSNCACNKKTKQWLSDYEVDIAQWQHSLQKQVPIPNSDIEQLLEERLFAQVRKSLQSDFDLLISRNWLQRLTNVTGRSKQYHRANILPIVSESNNHSLDTNLTPKAQAYVASALGRFSFLDPSFPVLAEQISEEELDEDNNRVFLYVDYVVPESSPLQDTVDQIQSELQEIWDSGEIRPLLLTYRSAHQNLIKECVVYPVCIYFMEHAKYLCAYGSTPRGEINWYKYRLDRIISKRLESLDWQDTRVPQLLREKYLANRLPTPKVVNTMLKQAWGCDFYKEIGLMILRFDRDFHQSYMEGIAIHHTFTIIDCDRAALLIKQYTPNPQQRHTLLQILHHRPTTDIYYQLYYRITDYYVVRWLRALGAKVEVMLPCQLREEIALDSQNTWYQYKFPYRS